MLKQIVFLPTLNRGASYEICSFGEDDWTIPETNAEKAEGYFLTEEQLIELIGKAMETASYNQYTHNDEGKVEKLNAQYIKELLK